MRALVAMDSFKGNLTSLEAGAAVARGLKAQGLSSVLVPMADGGEGSGEALRLAIGGRWHSQTATGPRGLPVQGRWLELKGRCALVEVASASGLPLVPSFLRDPMVSSSQGTGELIAAALDAGAREVMVTLGGSATVDGGWGLLAGLGLRGFGAHDELLRPCGGNLRLLRRLDDRLLRCRLAGVKLWAMADVTTPLLGPKGAAPFFGPQKGATQKTLPLLEEGLENWAQLLRRLTGRDVSASRSGGAAGGIGAALTALTGQPPVPGFDVITRALKLERILPTVDFVVTGEGRMDSGSAEGKVVGGMCRLASSFGLPTVALVGGVKEPLSVLHDLGLTAVFPVGDGVTKPSAVFGKTAEGLERTAAQVARLIGRF